MEYVSEIISTEDVDKCLSVMQAIIAKGKPVAIDAEGISLGATGRMTLLQICIPDEGRVYLIDLIDPEFPDDRERGKKLLVEGGVKEMLESSEVEKVIHSCREDSAALYHQFGIQLDASQLFDTQAADMALQSGMWSCRRRALNHIAETYGTPLHSLKHEHKGWLAANRAAWAIRPLPQKMIRYACEDVIVLMPELDTKLKRLLDERNAWPRYRSQLAEDIDSRRGLASSQLLQARRTRVGSSLTRLRPSATTSSSSSLSRILQPSSTGSFVARRRPQQGHRMTEVGRQLREKNREFMNMLAQLDS